MSTYVVFEDVGTQNTSTKNYKALKQISLFKKW